MKADRARAILAAVEKGADPVAEKHAQRAVPTVAELVEKYLTEGPADKPNKKASSWQTDASNLRSHVVPLLGRRRADTVTKRDIQQLQASVAKGETQAPERASGKARGRIRIRGGEGTAWRATVVAGAMFAWALGRGIVKSNPAEGVELKEPKGRERFLMDDEVLRLGDALTAAEESGANPRALDIIRVLLLTGARRNGIEIVGRNISTFNGAPRSCPIARRGRKPWRWALPRLKSWRRISARVRRGFSRPCGARATTGALARFGAKSRKRRAWLACGYTTCATALPLSPSPAITRFSCSARSSGTPSVLLPEKYAHLMLDPVRAVADQTSRRLADALGPIGREKRRCENSLGLTRSARP